MIILERLFLLFLGDFGFLWYYSKGFPSLPSGSCHPTRRYFFLFFFYSIFSLNLFEPCPSLCEGHEAFPLIPLRPPMLDVPFSGCGGCGGVWGGEGGGGRWWTLAVGLC